MSFISTGVEYGLHCLLYLSRSHAAVAEASVRDLAELQGVPNEYLAKLFTKLAKADLVVATEGIRGGFRLARPAGRITVHDVVVAIDGDKPCSIAARSVVDAQCSRRLHRRGHAWRMRNPRGHAAGGKGHACRAHAAHAGRSGAAHINKAPASHGVQIVHWLADRAANRRGDKEEGAPAKDAQARA